MCRPPALARAAGPASAGPGRAYGGQPAAQRAAARRIRFIEAGVQVFGTTGYRAATVRGVCAAAGLTDRYFYESFASLEDLLIAAYRGLVAVMAERLDRQALSSSAWAGDAGEVERQCALGYRLWFDAVRDERFARIVLQEVLGVSPAVDAVYEQSMREIAALTIAPLDRALPGLRWPAARREWLGRALVGAAVQVAKAWVAEGYRTPRREVVQTCVLVATGTLAALRAQEAAAPGRGSRASLGAAP